MQNSGGQGLGSAALLHCADGGRSGCCHHTGLGEAEPGAGLALGAAAQQAPPQLQRSGAELGHSARGRAGCSAVWVTAGMAGDSVRGCAGCPAAPTAMGASTGSRARGGAGCSAAGAASAGSGACSRSAAGSSTGPSDRREYRRCGLGRSGLLNGLSDGRRHNRCRQGRSKGGGLLCHQVQHTVAKAVTGR